MRKTLFALFFAGTFFSCQTNNVVKDYLVDNDLVWSKEDAHAINFSIEDEAQAYDVYASLRHSSYLDYAGIPIKAEITGTDGSVFSKEIVLALKNDKGELVGEALGGTTDTDILLAAAFKFPKKGNYTIKMIVTGDDNSYAYGGVQEIGVRIDKAK